MATGDSDLEAFIEHWSRAEASERANAQPFLLGLARLLDLPAPSNTHADGYSFEFPVKIPIAPGETTDGRIDLYRRGSFVLEAKQFVGPAAELTDLQLALGTSEKKKSGPVRGSQSWDEAMWKARGQAERYARHLPADEPSAPFLLVVDVGHTLEVYADFTQAGRAYQAFPDPRSFRLRLVDLRDEKVRDRLRRIWLEPLSLDPVRVSAEVTREIAGYLAALATSLEAEGHAPRLVAEFLTRCLFCMFAEDVGLLPKDGFRGLLESLRQSPEGFAPKLRQLFAELQTGTDFSVILNQKLLRFNGGLFADASVLPVNATQLGILIRAAAMQWKDVEPAIFGTLLERALDPAERHQLGAHYTPRAYVERLVLPTVIEPLRAEWQAVRAAALVHAQKGDLKGARAEITRFHTRLCEVTVLDPACGSGNFLYVTLALMKQLEGEVLDAAAGLGENLLLDLATHSVDPHQFLGLELNPRAAALAELVLWIGYLQWHFRTRGRSLPAEPVLKKFRNIECRDAVLAWDGDPVPVTWEMAAANPDLPGLPEDVRSQARGKEGPLAPGTQDHRLLIAATITVWDRRSFKTDPVTGREVPDETKRLQLLSYPNARPAAWPKADFIVGNPPFIGARTIRPSLGDGYLGALRSVYPNLADNIDLVMYWWEKAAQQAREGRVKRFGFITTNSFTQSFNRTVVERYTQEHLVSLVFAIPDHPWVDSVDGAAVRIAMTVGESGYIPGVLLKLKSERPGNEDGGLVEFTSATGLIEPNLTIGQDTGETVALKANSGVCCVGYQLTGTGFAVTSEQVENIVGDGHRDARSLIFPLLSARDITQAPRGLNAIDLCAFDNVEDILRRFPRVFQWVLTHVKPERDTNPRSSLRKRWWVYGEPRNTFRPALVGLNRMIVTPLTAKHRPFVFAPRDTIADSTTVMLAFDDAFHLGVLSSRIHIAFALIAGGHLGVGNDSRYNKSLCFDPFPYPSCSDASKARIRAMGEDLDAHRKRVQAQHPGLSLTAMYNVLEKLRAGGDGQGASALLTPKERLIHDQGLVSVLKQLHDELDAAVADAYGWPPDLSDAEILTRIVALNAERAAEEARGHIRWLRPEYQKPNAGAEVPKAQGTLALPTDKPAKPGKTAARAKKPAWPKPLADRVRAVEQALLAAGQPVTAAALAKQFTRAQRDALTEILETLVTLGRAHRKGDQFSL